MSEIKYQTFKDFLEKASLYEWINLPNEIKEENLSGDIYVTNAWIEVLPIDVYCPECQQHSVFQCDNKNILCGITGFFVKKIGAFCQFEFYCSRNKKHELLFVLKIEKARIQKIG